VKASRRAIHCMLARMRGSNLGKSLASTRAAFALKAMTARGRGWFPPTGEGQLRRSRIHQKPAP
jgi:hypothetical protein